MGVSRGTEEEPAEHATAVATERCSQCDYTARSLFGKQRGCDCNGLQWDKQHNWLLPRQARHDQQCGRGRPQRRDIQKYAGHKANGD